MRLLQGNLIADRFLLKRRLASGAMGSVWLAHHVGLGVPCAVKFRRDGLPPCADFDRRFEREARAAALLHCPNVVRILDYGVADGRRYIAMEYLEGETLETRLARLGRLSPVETVAILGQTARALARVHGQGIVHRDVKPSNIFIARVGDREVVKMLDFGIARLPAERSTRDGVVLGSPSYMSPEQAQCLPDIDHRSDLWSLAVLAYQCITGRLPFAAPSVVGVMVEIIHGPIPVPSAIVEVPASFDGWWRGAASRDPSNRFSSAQDLVTALAAAFDLLPRSLVPRRLSVLPEGRPELWPARLRPAPLSAFAMDQDPNADERPTSIPDEPAPPPPR